MLRNRFAALVLIVVLSLLAHFTGDVHAMLTTLTDESLAAATGLAPFQVDALIDSGYIAEEILRLSPTQVDKILLRDLTPAESARYRAAVEAFQAGDRAVPTSSVELTVNPIEDWPCVSVVPDGGGYNEYFHPNSNTNESNIAAKVGYAKTGCRRLFKVSYNYPSIRYSYYLHGEWGEDPGKETHVHEGVDLRNAVTSAAPVYCIWSGTVTHVNPTLKRVNIALSGCSATMNYQHVTGISVSLGQQVYYGQQLGTQSTTDAHVHVQVCSHSNCGVVHSSTDAGMVLTCVSPYFWLSQTPQ